MNKLILIFLLNLSYLSFSQTTEEAQVQTTIVEFFEAFHKQDTVALKAMVTKDVILQSMAKTKEGKSILRQDNFDEFIKSIASIPKENKFEEKLLGFEIKVDGIMANAWTPYEFWYNNNFSHCGVNSFQLMKVEDQWKIIYLVDTRRREGCNPKN